MNQRHTLRRMISLSMLSFAIALAGSGCASKKYARQQADAVNQRVSQVESKTNKSLAHLANKEQNDISHVNEQIMTTNNRVAENATAVQQASATASQALQAAQANDTKIAANATEIANVANGMNVTLIEKGDVTFGFNKSNLDDAAKAALDLIIQKAQAAPRAVVELVGFTDKVGSVQYNLALSRRRAESVQRYLIQNNIPPRGIHIVGMGEEQPPSSLAADIQAVDPNASRKEIRRLARRVYIRVYATGLSQGEAARATPNQ
jgi:outer membrane protein OmpA-like peptidoglycan-associated protein